MRSRIHPRGAVLLGDILQVEHDVHTVCHIPGRRRDCQLIRVQLHRYVSRPRNVGRVRIDDGVVAQVPRDDLVDEWMV